MIFGKNILNMAFSVIPPETIYYQKWIGNEINSIGLSVPAYEDPVQIKGSVQAVPARLYQQLGLDLNKNYKKVYVSANIIGTESNKTPDKFIFHGKTWLVVENRDWWIYDDWVGLLVCEDKDYGG